MNYPIAQLSPSSRIWIYLASRELSQEKASQLLKAAGDFLETWVAHNNALKAGAELLYNQILVIAVDENIAEASGCSIDKLHRFIKQAESSFEIKLLDRMRVAVKENNTIKNLSISDMQTEIASGNINGDTIVLNTLVETLAAFATQFEVPLHSTWMNRYLHPEKA
jgi:hypothetical protein